MYVTEAMNEHRIDLLSDAVRYAYHIWRNEALLRHVDQGIRPCHYFVSQALKVVFSETD